jgi:hypothetical protein
MSATTTKLLQYFFGFHSTNGYQLLSTEHNFKLSNGVAEVVFWHNAPSYGIWCTVLKASSELMPPLSGSSSPTT